MPIALSPEERLPVTFSFDEGRPEAERIVFRCKALTVAAVRRHRAAMKEAADAAGDKGNDLLDTALAAAITGWSRPEPFTVAALDEVVTAVEKWGIGYELPARLTDVELALKKVFASPSTSDTGNSAPVAAAETGPSAAAA